MATSVTCTIRGERDGYTVLNASSTNQAAVDHQLSLPSTFPDCLILEVNVQVLNVTTLASLTQQGPAVRVCPIANPGLPNDIVGTALWVLNGNGNEVGCVIDPDLGITWRRNELLWVTATAVEAAGPTADLDVYIKVKQLPTV